MKKTNQITINIDGHDFRSDAGRTILELARENQIDIPTLCHDPRLKPIGSCLLCVVEAEGSEKLLLSCATEAKDGMIIQTHTEKVKKARKNALDLLLSNHYADCVGPCTESCPAGVDIQGYLALAKAGNTLEALELIQQKNPFPLVCGRICVRYCELSCRRQEMESAVGINLVKRSIADQAYDMLSRPVIPPSNNKKVAIIGGGPCGLTAGFYLAREGYAVQLFESQPELGGMLKYGIPDYRLPREVLDREIQTILDHGIKVQTGVRLGEDFHLDELRDDNYDAIFLAIGAQKAKKMNIRNEEVEGVMGGIDFLENVKKEGPPVLKGTAVVVGGGNTAIDAARTAIRCEASRVLCLYRRSREEMPADDEEIADALAEGVEFEFLTAPLEIIKKNGRLQSLQCQRMELGEPDASGRRRPVPIEGKQINVICNHIIAAIGQDCDPSGLAENPTTNIELSDWNTIRVREDSTMTSVAGIFAGGDAVTGPAAAIDAIGTGRRAAHEIDLYLRKVEEELENKPFFSRKSNLGEIPASFYDGFEEKKRASRREVDAAHRVHDFEEVDLGINPACVEGESSRCLSCGCSELETCELKKYATDYSADQTRYPGKALKFKVDDRHPLILLDPNKCILCGKCVRICEEWLGVSALGFINRGYDMMVRPSQEKALQETACISCGNCIEVCPTGAITFNHEFEKFRHYPLSALPTICSICGMGCDLIINRKNDDFWNVTAAKTEAGVPQDICGRGRFGHRQLIRENRLTEPVIQKDGHRRQTTMIYAMNAAVDGLKKVSETYGPDQLGFFVSPRATNEEIFMAQKLARQVFQSGNVASLSDLLYVEEADGLETSFGLSASTATHSDVEKADVIVTFNANPLEENPVLGFKIKRAVRRGAELITISSTETELNNYATLWLNSRKGSNARLLDAISSEVINRGSYSSDLLEERTVGFEHFLEDIRLSVTGMRETGVERHLISKAADAISNPDKRVVFVSNRDSLPEKSKGDFQSLANLLILTGKAFQKGSGVLLCSEACNHQGYIDISRSPINSETTDQLCPVAWKELSSISTVRDRLLDGKFKGIFLLGEDLSLFNGFEDVIQKADFVVAIDSEETESTRLADVILPGSVIAESDGSITTQDRCVKSFSRVFDPPSGYSSLSILSSMAAIAGSFEKPDIEQIRLWISDLNPRYHKLYTLGPSGSYFWNERSNGGNQLYGSSFMTQSGKAVLSVERFDQQGRSGQFQAMELNHWHNRIELFTFEHKLKKNKGLSTYE